MEIEKLKKAVKELEEKKGIRGEERNI